MQTVPITPPVQQVPPLWKPTPDELFIRHGWDGTANGQTDGLSDGHNAEMRWSALKGHGDLVPVDRFFVRNHGATPRIDPATWRLRIEGSAVHRSLDLSHQDLERLPQHSVVCALECAGNGRAFFAEAEGHRQRAPGTQWRLGAIGVAEWRGVPLGTLLEMARVSAYAVDVMPEGLDEPRVRRPLPIGVARNRDTLVALRMNGEPLEPDHGFPARIIVPGWVGVASIKWVGRITVSTTPQRSLWSTERYVLRGIDPSGGPAATRGLPRGGSGRGTVPPEPPAMLTTQVPKAALELAWPAVLPRRRRTILSGRAWSPAGRIDRVEIAIRQVGDDRPRRWRTARLLGANRPRAWIRFELVWRPPPGSYQLWVRATDDHGTVQPDEAPWNDGGYLYGAVVPHPVEVR